MAPFSRDVVRAQDLLAVTFEFRNLLLVTDGPAGGHLVREQPGQDAFVIVHLPPQHTAEPVLPDGAVPALPQPGQLAGPSRLAFRLPAEADRIPFTLEALLGWLSLEPSLCAAARQPRDGAAVANQPPIAPEATETALEIPYHLLLSPPPGGGWAHATEPVTHAGRTELWHTRLGVRAVTDGRPTVDEGNTADRYVRAVYSPDSAGIPPALAGDLRPTAAQRRSIVALSAASPIEVDQLMLSARGGWFKARGQWPDAALSEWQHVATQGRDQYVRVTQEGVLFPFRHRAACIRVTERTIEESGGSAVAVLTEKLFILVREPVQHYAGKDFEHQGREMPFTDVRIATLFTPAGAHVLPDIDRVGDSPDGADQPFWIMNATPPGAVPFHLIGTDCKGNDTDFQAALIFVPLEMARDPSLVAAVQADYRRGDPLDASVGRLAAVSGVPVDYVRPEGDAEAEDLGRPRETTLTTDGMTTLTTDGMTFDVKVRARSGESAFMPILESAQVRAPAVDRLLGSGQPMTIVPSPTYLNGGMTASNPAGLFAQLVSPLEVDLPADRGAALARPNMAVRGLSSTLGPVGGDLDQLTAQVFDPATFFADSAAKLMGGVPLAQLVSSVFEARQFPLMSSRATPISVVTTVDWEPKVDSRSDLLRPLPEGPPISLALHAQMEQSPAAAGGPPRTTVHTSLENFRISFAGVLGIRFDSLSFRSENGSKPTVSVAVPDHAVDLERELSFFSALGDCVGGSGMGSAPALEVSPAGVLASYAVALPPIALGAFLLENVRLGVSLHLPFTDARPTLRFSFGDRNDEFLVTVEGLGGGGFFALSLGLDGIETIEASLEIGAAVALDFGVASGTVAVMVGVYVRYDAPPVDAATVTGFQRQSGEVEVLGFVNVSIDFYLGLTYETDPERLEGVATLTVKVDLTLFSESVELTVRRTFAGGTDRSGDPPFGDVTSASDWQAYASAFA
ncbi:hypothetical protein [Streptomyces griseosporeus]|uniref:hypothetical protein n=1 Tax=Streptomyces griseosporeus TaxID=1910 RepID=UPI00167E7E23|nr:hypothetical protein [Streptomyces griseosporeus]GHF36304.1 hypothetical protein GCM10018783_00740 [Streptomyces griseosporeus]